MKVNVEDCKEYQDFFASNFPRSFERHGGVASFEVTNQGVRFVYKDGAESSFELLVNRKRGNERTFKELDLLMDLFPEAFI